jgi:hypothetical protein
MGAYLTRNKSRFIFSHKSVWFPLRGIKEALLKGEQAFAFFMHHGCTPFFHQCVALCYSYRPLELEAWRAFDFFSLFEVVQMTSNREEELLQFHNGAFQHAFYHATNNCFLQGVKQRSEAALIKRCFNMIFQTQLRLVAPCLISIAQLLSAPNNIVNKSFYFFIHFNS